LPSRARHKCLALRRTAVFAIWAKNAGLSEPVMFQTAVTRWGDTREVPHRG
jgi:hypothetical protein